MEDPYEGREQSAAKHEILRTYLQRLAFKVAWGPRGARTINYVDAFAGPWESKQESLDDTSPSIALRTLLDVRRSLAARGVNIEVRGFFVSRTLRGVAQLQRLEHRFPDAKIEIVKGTFEEALPAAQAFASGGQAPFTFVFIDPTGWKGFSMQKIAPLLKIGRGEVLINFMLEHIRRFADHNDASLLASIEDLFGDTHFRDEWQGTSGEERDDLIVAAYCRRIAARGDFKHCASTPIFQPTKDREYFRLVYATRSDVGLVTFREVETKGLAKQKQTRTKVKGEKRVEQSGQGEMFTADVMQPSRTYEDLTRERHLNRALNALDAMMSERMVIEWDLLVMAGLSYPLVREADVKNWLKQRVEEGAVKVIGLEGRQSVPQLGKGHHVRKTPPADRL